ncbi:unnamed protein product [Orchesella dallaii]|uniref:Uncharacterized protein n=1 Tax=Orchesella dallaii TaxID=48710 RepID=A0ABP1PNQ6_9HEXA
MDPEPQITTTSHPNAHFFLANAKQRTSLNNSYCDFSGENNEGLIQDNVSLKISCHQSQLQIENNFSSTIETTGSSVSVRDCKDSVILGKFNSIQATTNTRLIVASESERNSAVVNDSNTFNLSGSGCTIVSNGSDSVDVKGDKNQMMLEKSSAIRISGSDNKVRSIESNHLNVKGNGHEVMAHQSNNIEINGNGGKVALADVGSANHYLWKYPEEEMVAPGANKQNELIIRAPTYTSFRPQLWDPRSHFRSDITIYEDKIFMNGRLVNPENYEALGLEKIEKIEHYNIYILFADVVSIQGNEYKAGIFHFKLFQNSSDVRFMTVELITKDLDEGSYVAEMQGTESVMIFGSKDGIFQQFKIVAKQITAMENGGERGFTWVSGKASSMEKFATHFLISVM